MIDNSLLRKTVIKGLRDFLKVEVIKENQNAEPPNYPYISYNVITLESSNNGTYGVYKDGVERLPVKQTWSINIMAEDDAESIMLASKARDFFNLYGTQYLNDNEVIVESVTGITNRDNLISIDYEYKNGFDVVFWCMSECKRDIEVIESINIEDYNINVSKERS